MSAHICLLVDAQALQEMGERLQSSTESHDASAAERLATAERRAAAAESALQNAHALRAAAQEAAEKAEARAASAEEALRQLRQYTADENGSVSSCRAKDREIVAQYHSSGADAGAVIIDIGEICSRSEVMHGQTT